MTQLSCDKKKVVLRKKDIPLIYEYSDFIRCILNKKCYNNSNYLKL